MKKHLYFHSSNLDYTKYLKEDSRFEPTYFYSLFELEKSHRHEFGRIKTDDNYFHLIMGNPLQEKCPWCNTLPKLKKIDSVRAYPLNNYDSYCFECAKCGSRGPLKNVNDYLDEEMLKWVQETMKAIYQQRIPWDQDLKHED